MAASPYDGLDRRAFWRTAVATRSPSRLRDLYAPRFRIGRTTRILTAGSCFAQHIHHALADRGFAVINREPPPDDVAPAIAARFFYGTFSARYGNIYTARQFLQLIQEAAGECQPAHPVWSRDGRFVDALRPNVDPGGFGSAAAVRAARRDHLAALALALTEAEVVVFTLGQTETWQDRASGTVYPVAPGVLADPPEAADIGFLNLSYDQTLADMRAALARLRAINPGMRLLLSVSPVPLTATASGRHVLVASSEAKAVLRAVVAALMADDPGVDYFPAYEIVTNPAARSHFLAANLRTPTQAGVRTVLNQFLSAQASSDAAADGPDAPADILAMNEDEAADAICEEMFTDPQGGKGGAG